MANYIDGFVLPIPKDKVNEYKKIAKKAGKIWLKHGALAYVESMGDDVKPGKTTSFPQSVKLKANEIVFFSWIVYKSKAHRTQVLKKVMADPWVANMGPDMMPFDMKRMIYGGFKTVVSM